MTTATIEAASNRLPHQRDSGPAPTRIVVAYGFWIFILSDIVMFSALFAAYAVLAGNTAGGPTGADLFNVRNVFLMTMCLLVSSYTCGLGALSAEQRKPEPLLDFRRPYVRARRGLPFPRDLGIRRHDRQGRRALAQRLSVRLLHFGRHARHACQRRPHLAHLHGGSGCRQGLACGRAATPVVLQPLLACARYRLDRGDDAGLPDGSASDGTVMIACLTIGPRVSKSTSRPPAFYRTRWDSGSRSWRRSPRLSWLRPICCGPRHTGRSDRARLGTDRRPPRLLSCIWAAGPIKRTISWPSHLGC